MLCLLLGCSGAPAFAAFAPAAGGGGASSCSLLRPDGARWPRSSSPASRLRLACCCLLLSFLLPLLGPPLALSPWSASLPLPGACSVLPSGFCARGNPSRHRCCSLGSVRARPRERRNNSKIKRARRRTHGQPRRGRSVGHLVVLHRLLHARRRRHWRQKGVLRGGLSCGSCGSTSLLPNCATLCVRPSRVSRIPPSAAPEFLCCVPRFESLGGRAPRAGRQFTGLKGKRREEEEAPFVAVSGSTLPT